MIKNKSKLRTFLRMISSNRKLKYRWFGSRKKSLRKPSPTKKKQQPKPNPISNLTLTLTLTPHRGLFSRGGFFPDTRWFMFLVKIYFKKMSWHIAACYINLVKAIIRHQKLRQNMQRITDSNSFTPPKN